MQNNSVYNEEKNFSSIYNPAILVRGVIKKNPEIQRY